jgi:hypothetical protein
MKEREPGKEDLITGYHRPICKKCECEMRCEENGVGVLDMAGGRSNARPYKLYDADLYKCPKCGIEVIGGFGYNPISGEWKSDFQHHIDWYENNSHLIRNYEFIKE